MLLAQDMVFIVILLREYLDVNQALTSSIGVINASEGFEMD